MASVDMEKAIQEELKLIPKEHLKEVLGFLRRFREQEESPDEVLGMFADEPDLLDQIVESAMEAREKHGLRAGE